MRMRSKTQDLCQFWSQLWVCVCRQQVQAQPHLNHMDRGVPQRKLGMLSYMLGRHPNTLETLQGLLCLAKAPYPYAAFKALHSCIS